MQSRQREYKLAALHAKQQGDTAAAAKHFRVAKVRPVGSGLEVEDRMLLTLCDSKEQGLWSQDRPRFESWSLRDYSFLHLLKPQFTLSVKWA